MPAKVTIDAEFAALCPKQTDEELAYLEGSLLDEGCREPIIYWKSPGNPILDGMTRFNICEKHDMNTPLKPMELPDRHAAICWILRNQLGRRNLTDAQRTLAMGRLFNEQKNGHGGDHKSQKPLENKDGSKYQSDTLIDTAAKIAKEEGVGVATVKRAGKAADAVDTLAAKAPAVAKAIEAGTIPLSSAAALADAPKADLKKLEKNTGPELRKAAQATAKKTTSKPAPAPKNGQPTFNPQAFETVYEYLGHALPKLGALNRTNPAKFYTHAERAVKEAMQAVKDWKKAVAP